MSSTMDILAREVIGYHFCQMDNEETCVIPHFVHSLAAQMSQSPMLSSYRKLIANDGKLQVSCIIFRPPPSFAGNCIDTEKKATRDQY